MTGPSVGFRVRHLKALLVRDGGHVARVRRRCVLQGLGFGVWSLETRTFQSLGMGLRVEG